MIADQSKAPPITHERYTAQIQEAAERLEVLQRNLASHTMHQTEIDRARLQDSALAALCEIRLDEFWQLSPKEINRRLRYLFGNVRMVADKGQIVGLRQVSM